MELAREYIKQTNLFVLLAWSPPTFKVILPIDALVQANSHNLVLLSFGGAPEPSLFSTFPELLFDNKPPFSRSGSHLVSH